ncbi:MAG: hypothetical protein HYT87_17870, partial [Nitrospirae bacterium]|nr:hypothetical protein [Nitrospirota bacterium]
ALKGSTIELQVGRGGTWGWSTFSFDNTFRTQTVVIPGTEGTCAKLVSNCEDLGDLEISPDTRTVMGSVVDSENLPVQFATVVLRGTLTPTDAQGRFRLESARAEDLMLTVAHPRGVKFGRANLTVHVPGISPANRCEDVLPVDLGTIRLEPALGCARGKVRDENGTPVSGATLAAGGAVVQTDTGGNYCLESNPSQTDLVFNYYDRGQGRTHNKRLPIQIVGGGYCGGGEKKCAHADIDLVLGPSCVSGTVTDQKARPLAGVSVRAGSRMVMTSADGAYCLEAPAQQKVRLKFKHSASGRNGGGSETEEEQEIETTGAEQCGGSCMIVNRSIQVNEPPVITRVEPSKSVVLAGEEITISVSASDPEGDRLSYTWAAGCGDFSKPKPQPGKNDPSPSDGGPLVAWKAPSSEGTCSISVVSEDPKKASALAGIVVKVERDTMAPETVISTQPSTPSNETSATIAFSCSDPGTLPPGPCSFFCQLDIGTPTSCVSPATLSPVAEGAHTFTVYAVDKSGNKDATPAALTWTVDTLAPETGVGSQLPAISNQTSATFTFTCNETDCAFQCSIDSAAFASCASPLTLSALTGGSHTFDVRAVDPAGNVDGSPATRAWSIDLTPPTVVIGAKPSAIVNQASASFTFNSTDAAAAFQCTLDSAAYSSCASPLALLPLAQGSHTFQVQATDSAGNVSSAASYTWTVDTISPLAPNVSLLTLNTNPPGSQDTLSGTAGAVEGGAQVKVYADGLLTNLLASTDATANGSFASISVGDNAAPTLYVTATDAAGNVSSVTTVANDIAAPTGTSVIISAGATFTSTTAVTLTLSATGATEMAFSNDNLTYGAYQPYATSFPWTLTAGDGTKTVYARFRDAAGNLSSQVSDTIVLDTGPPDTTLASTAPSVTPTNSTSLSASFTSNDASATFECSLDAAAFASCTSPHLIAGPLSSGAHTINVRAKDQANNVDATPASYVWMVDTTAPAAPVSGNITVNQNPPGTPDSVQGSLGAVEVSATVKIYSDSGLTNLVVSVAAGANGSFGALTIGDNLYTTVYITATDAAGNASASISKTNNTSGSTNPTLTPADQTSGSTGYTNSTTVNATIGNDADATAWCLSETQSSQPASSDPCFTSPEPSTFVLTAVEGSHSLYVWTKNSAGNVNPGPAVSASITLDSVAPPNPTISVADQTSSSTGTTNSTSVNASIGGDAEAAFWCLSETQSASPAELSSCFTSPRPTTFTLSAGDGSHTVYIWIKDVAGNINAGPAVSASITLDTAAPPNPTLGLSDQTSGSATATNAATVNVSITGDTGASTWCLSETQSASPGELSSCFVSPEPTTLTLIAGDGGKTAYVWIKDAAGNINAGPAVSASITLDTTAPPNPALALSDATSGSGASTNSTLVNTSITSDTGASKWCLSETQTTAPVEADACFVSPKPTTFTLSAGDTSHTVYAWIKDAAGNINGGPAVSASIALDTAAPPNPTLSLADPSPTTSGYTNNNPVNATVGNDAGVSHWCLSESQSAQPAESAGCLAGTEPTTFTLSAVEGPHTVYAWVRDAAGNVNPGPAISASITLDTIAPTTPVGANLAVTANPSGTNDTLSGAVGAVEGSATVKVYSDGLLTVLIGQSSALGDGSFAAYAIGDNQGDASDQIYVTQTDQAGNTSSVTIKINDKTPPPNPTLSISDPTPASAGYTNNNPVNATIGNDAQAVGWCLSETQSTAPAAAHACFAGTEPTTFTLSAVEGSHTVYAWVKDAGGNVNTGPSVSATITLDTTLPTGGAVNDGTGADVAYQISNTTMAANWSGFSDANGIASYDYNISTAGSCAGDTLATANLGNVTSKSTGALSLALGASYFNCVRALDNAGNASAWAASNSVMVDYSLPTSSITAPANGAKLSALSSVTGSASDTGSGVQTVEITIQRNSDSQYWDGSAWGAGVAWLAATGTTSWSKSSGLPAWASGSAYTVQSKATDNAANAQSPTANASFTFDNTAPTFAGLASATAVSSSQIDLSWSAASDAVSPASSLIYKICQSTTAGTCQTSFTVTYTTSASATSYSVTALNATTAYYFVARAEDEAGNTDTNTVEKTATTSSPPVAGVIQAVTNHLGRHTCALLSDGTVRCWGHNNSGQLGDGTNVNRLAPVAVSSLSGAVALSEGYFHTCSLLSDGTAECWGSNMFGQLGDGTTVDKTTPVAVSSLSNTVAIAGGSYLSNTVAIAGGSYHSCSLLSDGTVKCWGNNIYGGLGDGTTAKKSTPVAVSALSGAVAVAAGEYHTCSLLSDGSVKCWGYNGFGQLGDGTSVDRLSPIAVSTLSNAVAIAGGLYHTCVLLSDGSVKCWGSNGFGGLGDGTTTQRLTPIAVSSLSNAVSVAGGYQHSCSLLSDGTLKCWGNNGYGQLGDGTTTYKTTPTAVTSLTGPLGVKLPRLHHEGSASGAPARPWREGLTNHFGYHTCSLLSNGTVKCWGNNQSGQLGDGTTANKTTPVAVSSLSGSVAVAGGGNQTCSLLSNGTVDCWGYNFYGQLGDGTTVNKTTPAAVIGLSGAVAVAGGYYHTCSLLSDGTVKCWGWNPSGQLGDGTTADRLTPITVSSLSGGVALAVGYWHTCSLLSDGTVKCWGLNSSGQLGDGTTANRLTPIAVSSLFGGVAIVVGYDHTCSLLSDGTVKCWGNNQYGQLGDGTLLVNKTTPVAVSGLSGGVAVAAGREYTCSLLSDGTMKCWGRNFYGQLGDGTTADRTTPVAVSGLSGGVTVANGYEHTCSLLSDGTVKCWGYNFYGQLGDGTTVDRHTPVQVQNLP